MAILNKFPIYLVCVALLTSCYEDFDPKIDSTPVVCVNADIIAGQPLEVDVTRTWRWNEADQTTLDVQLRDARVSLTVNGSPRGDLEYRLVRGSEGGLWGWDAPVYRFTTDSYTPAPGDVISLEVTDTKYGTATATETVPSAVPIDRVEYTVSDISVEDWWDYKVYRFDMSLLVYFTDPADRTDFYQFTVGRSDYINSEDGMAVIDNLYVDYEKEPLFSEHVSTLESIVADNFGYTMFSDRQISGKTYPLHILLKGVSFHYNNPDDLPQFKDCAIELNLQTLSRDYYNHILSVWQANDGLAGVLGGVGMGESVPAYSNVSTRAGIVGAKAQSVWSINILDLIKNGMSE